MRQRLLALLMPEVGVGRSVYLFTLATEVIALGSGVLVLVLAGHAFGPEGFGEYAVARRLIALAGATLGLGTGVGLPRLLARGSSAQSGSRLGGGLHLTAALIYTAPAIVIASVAWAASPWLREQLLPLGDTGLAWATLAAAIGFAVHVIAHGYYRGVFAMWTAGGIYLVNLSIAPIVAMLLAGDQPTRAVALTAAMWLGTSTIMIVFALSRARWQAIPAMSLPASLRAMAAFTLPRVPGDVALLALFAVPALLVAREDGPIAAGVLSFGLSTITLLSGVLAGVGQVLLPRVAMLAHAEEWEQARRLVRRSMWLWIATTTAGTLVLVAAMPQVLELAVGAEYREQATVARVTALAAIPYTVYLALRNPLDAASAVPFNTINLAATLGISIILLTVASGAVAAEWSLLISFTMLAVFSWGSWDLVLRQQQRAR